MTVAANAERCARDWSFAPSVGDVADVGACPGWADALDRRWMSVIKGIMFVSGCCVAHTHVPVPIAACLAIEVSRAVQLDPFAFALSVSTDAPVITAIAVSSAESGFGPELPLPGVFGLSSKSFPFSLAALLSSALLCRSLSAITSTKSAEVRRMLERSASE